VDVGNVKYDFMISSISNVLLGTSRVRHKITLLGSVSFVLAFGLMRAVPTNLILIMADDMGYGDLSCYGNKAYQTPHLDRMAAEGMRFTDFHSSGPVCSPTRAGLMTGRYQQRSGIPGVINAAFGINRHHGLQHAEVTLPEVLREAGYRTAIFGKWHLGYREKFNPVHQGFETFRGYVSGNIDYHSHIDRMGVFDWWNNNVLEDETGYSTQLITDHALKYIGQHQQDPFFLYLAYEAPHDPYQGPGDPPIRVEGELVSNRYETGRIPRAYREMVQTMDTGIGRILAKLKSLSIDRQTLVFFLSDNGANKNGQNGELKGFKGSLWEGGHRVPAIAWWPTVIPPNCFCDDLSISLDVMPTFLEISGAKIPEGHFLDGQSLKPAFLQGSLPDRMRKLFWSYGSQLAMREGPWKLWVDSRKSGSAQLFHLDEDIAEKNNLILDHELKFERMKADLGVWYGQVTQSATAQ
jgi:arylsulfatase A-like enzyme